MSLQRIDKPLCGDVDDCRMQVPEDKAKWQLDEQSRKLAICKHKTWAIGCAICLGERNETAPGA